MSETSTETSLLTSSRSASRCYNIRLFMSELVGTFLLITFVNGSYASAILGAGPHSKPDTLHMALGSGFGLTVAVICTFKISGGHLNPALSFAMYTIKQLTFQRFCLYAAGQYLGAFLASWSVYGIYADQIRYFESFINNTQSVDGEDITTYSLKTAQIFATFPSSHTSLISCAFDQIFGTMLLLTGVLAITDQSNLGMPVAAQPFAFGLLLTSILLGFGLNCGAALNPARDLAPRIVITLGGWGTHAFSFRGYLWFWIPVVCPHIGAIIGTCLYQFTFGGFMRYRPSISMSLNRVNYY